MRREQENAPQTTWLQRFKGITLLSSVAGAVFVLGVAYAGGNLNQNLLQSILTNSALASASILAVTSAVTRVGLSAADYFTTGNQRGNNVVMNLEEGRAWQGPDLTDPNIPVAIASPVNPRRSSIDQFGIDSSDRRQSVGSGVPGSTTGNLSVERLAGNGIATVQSNLV